MEKTKRRGAADATEVSKMFYESAIEDRGGPDGRETNLACPSSRVM